MELQPPADATRAANLNSSPSPSPSDKAAIPVAITMAKQKQSGGRTSRWHQRLSFKQAILTFGIALMLGSVASFAQLYTEWRHALREAALQVQRIPDGVNRSISFVMDDKNEAVRPLILDAIFANPLVERVTLRDKNNQEVANEFRPRVPTHEFSEKLGVWLFAQIRESKTQLTGYNFETKKTENLGTVEVALSPTMVADGFYERISREWKAALLQPFIVAMVLVALSYWLVTKPLIGISDAMNQVDPRRPGNSWKAPRLQWHKRDELGMLVGTMDKLTDSLQVSLDEQSRGQRQLFEMNLGLEKRVSERTKELEGAVKEVEAGKRIAEDSLAEIDYANAELSKAITLVMDSINYAKRIQMALLPSERQLREAVREFSVWWEPLHVVGGDFYMVQKCGDKTLIVLADCTGHGVPGAFITLVVANALDQLLRTQQALQMEDLMTPDELLALLDEQVRQRLHQSSTGDAPSDDGLDAAICMWDPKTGELSYAGAGIPLLHVRGGEWSYMKADRGGIGYFSNEESRVFERHTVKVQPGDTYYIFTDGVTDHLGGTPARLLGRRRLAQFLALNSELPLPEITEAVQIELDAYRGDNERRDDCAFMAFRPI